MTKAAVRLAREALAVGRAALPAYSSRYSRHDHTQPQLFAPLALKQFLKTDDRGVVALAAEWTERRGALGLTAVPRYSTLCYAERRLLKGGPSPGSRTPAVGVPTAAGSSHRSRSPRWTRPGSSRAT
jgi:hypothetical protein